MSKLAMLLHAIGRNSESKAAALATAATTGIAVAKFLGRRSIYGAVAGVGVSLIAKKMAKKSLKRKQSDSAKDVIIDHAPLQPDPNAPKRKP
ncbi:hypothetical protein [Vitreoscilla stercoraria]|uniref:DUF883 domain-containing protein n=1 Tax=Vitreoscilla stercoraria TaxID=61 RepID=A0ABY4E8V3_VITST|nr:hypothetical protein [Vitreoscilla stercoraria]UOO92171.1 hypothetical protein LVJ81_11200 [Vitreoscilla stercoraria]